MLIVIAVGTAFAFEFSEYTVDENAGDVIVSILLLETELAVPVSLQLIPSDISACENTNSYNQAILLLQYYSVLANGEDYTLSISVQVEFPKMSVPGDRVNISIAILADDVVENQETFKLTLVSPSPSATALDSSTITIIDQSGKYKCAPIVYY